MKKVVLLAALASAPAFSKAPEHQFIIQPIMSSMTMMYEFSDALPRFSLGGRVGYNMGDGLTLGAYYMQSLKTAEANVGTTTFESTAYKNFGVYAGYMALPGLTVGLSLGAVLYDIGFGLITTVTHAKSFAPGIFVGYDYWLMDNVAVGVDQQFTGTFAGYDTVMFNLGVHVKVGF